MHRFIEKYSDSIKDSDVVKIMLHEMEEAYKDCKNGKKDYMEHLNEVAEMIKDYKEIKGLNAPFVF